MTNVVELQDVSFSYSDISVLKNVTFNVKQGEFIGIIGPNGGGKTTLLKLIMGVLNSQTGCIRVLGSPPSHSITKVAYVPQSLRYDRLFPISVLELVLSGRLSRLPWYGMYSSEDKKVVDEALDLVGMLPYKHCAFGNISGGQSQRALIARALVSEPELLLLDEPTANVDSQAESLIYSILKQLQNKMTIMMVTHDLHAAIDIVDRVLCVQGGVLSLLPQEVCEHFALGLYHSRIQMGK